VLELTLAEDAEPMELLEIRETNEKLVGGFLALREDTDQSERDTEIVEPTEVETTFAYVVRPASFRRLPWLANASITVYSGPPGAELQPGDFVVFDGFFATLAPQEGGSFSAEFNAAHVVPARTSGER
jgi:hypothetical protein